LSLQLTCDVPCSNVKLVTALQGSNAYQVSF
jgi:hypothetical protein